MIEKVGMVVTTVGFMAADSDYMWIPIAIILVGLAMILADRKEKK